MKVDFKNIRTAIFGLKDEIGTLNARLEALHQERDQILAAPLAKSDVLQALHSNIDQDASRYQKVLCESLANIASQGKTAKLGENAKLLTAVRPGYNSTPPTMESVLSLALGDELKKAAGRILDSMEWPEGAISAQEEKARLIKLDAEISLIEQERAALAREAAAAGISI